MIFDIYVRHLRTASLDHFNVLLRPVDDDIPGFIWDIVIDHEASEVIEECNVQKGSVVRPRAKLQVAELGIKGEESRIKFTGASEDCLWHPDDCPGIVDHH